MKTSRLAFTCRKLGGPIRCVYSLSGIHSVMPKARTSTRDRIVSAASKLFYDDGIKGVSLDAVAEKAGLTKRTLYYHFRSKDDLVAAYLEARDQPNLTLFKRWFDEAKGGLPDKVQAIFNQLARSARHPKWRGCGFLRTSAELANMPGHPAIKIGAAHKKKFEAWLCEAFEAAKIKSGARLSDSVAPCYAELIGTTIFYHKAMMYGSNLFGGWVYREFAATGKATKSVAGAVKNPLENFPAKTEAQIEAAKIELRDAYAKDFVEYVDKKVFKTAVK